MAICPHSKKSTIHAQAIYLTHTKLHMKKEKNAGTLNNDFLPLWTGGPLITLEI